jgi:hypothetical protein
VLGAGCSTTAEWTPARPGAWVGSDLHVHTSLGSNDTDGLSFAADHAAVAVERGLSLIVLTDHSNCTGSMDCPGGDVEDCPNQGPEWVGVEAAAAASDATLAVRVGLEASPRDDQTDPVGHVNCLPRAGGALTDFGFALVDRPMGAVAGGAAVRWCWEAGGLPSVNHPFGPTSWVAYDWSGADYAAMEVFNGGAWFDQGDADAVAAWVCDLDAGRAVVPLGGSDTHAATTPSPPATWLDSALGWPTTWLWSEGDDGDAHLAALEAGRTVVGDPATRLDLQVRVAGGPSVGPGDALRVLAGRPVELRLRARTTADADLRLELLDLYGACLDDPRWDLGAAPTVAPEVLAAFDLVPGVALDERLSLPVDGPRRLALRAWPADDRFAGDGAEPLLGVALSAAVALRVE